jgi:hypothetical protein
MTSSMLRLPLIATLLATAGLAHAADINALSGLNASEFRALSEDLSAAVSYKPLVPAEGLGIVGFDIGLSVGGTKLAHRDTFERAAGGASVPAVLPMAAVRVHKGLPFGIDLGASLSALPGTNIRNVGGELRWAFIEGGTVTPAVAVRAAVSSLQGVDQLKLNTRSLDLSISKGFLMFTPYAGVGQVWTTSEATISSGATKESFTKPKVFVGLNVNLGVNLAIEGDRTGDTTSYGAKLGLRF